MLKTYVACYQKEVPYTWTSLLHLSFDWESWCHVDIYKYNYFYILENKPTMFIKNLTTFSYIVGNKNSKNILLYALAKSSFNKIISSLDLLA
jgi:hypothetical protein